MKQLGVLSARPRYRTTAESVQAEFYKLRHYLGRIGHHFRAAKALVLIAPKLQFILDEFEVKSTGTPSKPTETPQLDRKTTLDRMIVRMLPEHSPELQLYQQALAEMNSKYQLEDRFLKSWRDPNFRPRVHAEIMVLEHFYDLNLTFADFDRYIACSKPACYCCSLYIRHHPGNFVEPATHNNVWLNWKPPDPKPECTVSERIQRDILNLMTRDVRRAALDQIMRRHAPYAKRPDSVTGITQTTRNAMEGPEELLDSLGMRLLPRNEY
jgi:hypothetical protein